MDKVLKAQKILNNRGFSLVQTFVGIGLFGLLALAGVNILKQQTITAEYTSLQPNLAFLVDSVRTRLSSSEVCKLNFEGKSAQFQQLDHLVNNGRLLLEVESILDETPSLRVSRLTLTEDHHEVSIAAGTTHLVLNFTHIPTQTQHQRMIKLHVALDNHSRITNCYTTGGIGQSEAEVQATHWSVTPGAMDVSYTHGPLVLTAQATVLPEIQMGTALMADEIQLLANDTVSCQASTLGALRLGRSGRRLEYCSKSAQWTPLNAPTLTAWTHRDFEHSSTENLQRRFPLRDWNICTLMNWSFREGVCQLSNLGGRNWVLETIQNAGTPVTCRVRCFRPRD